MFMMGSKNGILLVGLSWIGLLICLVPVQLPFGPDPPAFPRIVKARFVVTHGAITVLAYVYELARERSSRQSRERHAALQRAHAEIEQLSITDSLTGCFNRVYFNKQIHQEIHRARRYSTSVALLLLDIDFFKRINDEYGHSAGDRVLSAAGQSLRSCLRDGVDWVCRYGGEEFVIVLPHTGMEGAIVLAERIRAAIAELRVPTERGTLSVTASIGISSASRDGDTVPEIIDASDRRMYQAKKSGRNRICFDDG